MQIHDRDAHDAVLETLERVGAPERTVFHCFSGDADMARIAAERGYYLSFAGNITFKNAQNLRDALAVIPRELILVETDAPFLTPTPHRGRPNAPYLIPVTLRFMAAELGVERRRAVRAGRREHARGLRRVRGLGSRQARLRRPDGRARRPRAEPPRCARSSATRAAG